MRNLIQNSVLWLATMFLFASQGFSQYDDLYYDPDRQQSVTTTSTTSDRTQDLSFGEQSGDYDSEHYDYQKDYDFYYSSRINRFHRPNRGFDFYSPMFVDMAYYGYRTPGVSIYVGTGYYNPMRPRMHPHFGPHFHDPFYRPHAFHRPYNPWRPMGGFGYSYHSWGYSGFGYAGCPAFYSSSTYYVYNVYNSPGFVPGQSSSNAVTQNVQYGPRTSTGGTTARRGRTAEAMPGTTPDDKEELRAPTRTNEERLARDNDRVAPRESDRETRTADSRTSETLDRSESAGLAERSSQESQRADRRARGSEGTSTAAIPSRRTQEQFRDNRVDRSQADRDTRTNVPQTRSADRTGTDNRIFNNPRTNTRQGSQNTGRQSRDLNRGDQNNTRTSPNINRNRNNSGSSSPNINRGSNQRNTSPLPNLNRGNNNNTRSSGSFSPRRSSGSNNSSGVSPSRRGGSNSSSGSTRSNRSGRGG